ncbi:MAG TPA: TIGR03620 family F420-dependent LLM class oxidoreductase [Actinopolymorphaceae bacterium]
MTGSRAATAHAGWTVEARVGVWWGKLAAHPISAVKAAAAKVEELGYGSLWIGDTPGARGPFTHAGLLLGATERLAIGTGIVNIWGRDAMATKAEAYTLAEAYPGRFVLGLGVSHDPAVALRGQRYEKPLTKMRAFLDDYAAIDYRSPAPAVPPPIVLAALRRRMLELARDRTAGAHPYFVPTSHTARAREALGEGPLLVPEQAVVLETDPARARAIAREHTAVYLTLPNYVGNLRRLGFSADDVANGGSDRLVDAIVAWGDVDAIRSRVNEHLDAGADHVLLQPLEPASGLGLGQLRELAPAVLEDHRLT